MPGLQDPERHPPAQPHEKGAKGGVAHANANRWGIKAVCLLGGGKREGEPMDGVYEDEDAELTQPLTPGHLRDRLAVLQAIRALPAECRDDMENGQVETRVWGLEALKHVLRMRLALQRKLRLCRPVEE